MNNSKKEKTPGIINSNTGQPYFTITGTGWSGTWAFDVESVTLSKKARVELNTLKKKSKKG